MSQHAQQDPVGAYTDEERRVWVRDYLVAWHHISTKDADALTREGAEFLKGEPLNVLGKFVRSFAVITHGLCQLFPKIHVCDHTCNTVE